MSRMTTWGEIATLKYGRALKGYSKNEWRPVRVYGTNGPIGYTVAEMHKGGRVIVGRKGAYRGVHYAPDPFWVIDTAYYLDHGEEIDSRWAYYSLLCTDINGIGSGSAVPGTTKDDFYALKVRVPSLDEQKAAAEALGALDDKIAANDRLVQICKDLASAHFASALLRGSARKTVGDVAIFHNRRRVPLSSRERESMKGAVPYYGAAGMIDRLNEALFDDRLVLVGEDGSVIRQDGSPVVQYIWGPAWVNNHAHVLAGRNVSSELLMLALEKADVAHLVTGAVQPKISMTNLKSLKLEWPDPEQIPSLESLVQSLLSLVRSMTEESSSLATTRDELLPLLMSGKVRVKDAEKIAEEAL